MGLEAATTISDLVTTNPTASDGISQGDDHLRLIKTTLSALSRRVLHKTSTETGTTVTAVAGTIHNCTNAAAVAITLPASPTAGDIFGFHLSNGLATNTFLPNGNDFGNVSGTYTIAHAVVGQLIVVEYLDAATGYVLRTPVNFVAAELNYTASTTDCTFFVADRPYVVKSIRGRVDVAGTGGACTAQIRKTASGTAPASGTVLHSSSFNLVGTANSNQTLTLSTTASDLQLAAGDALSYDLTGTATSAVGNITVLLSPA